MEKCNIKELNTISMAVILLRACLTHAYNQHLHCGELALDMQGYIWRRKEFRTLSAHQEQ